MAVKKETIKKEVTKKPVEKKPVTPKKPPVKKAPTKKKPTKKKVESDITYIYGIYLSGELCYVGSSGNFEQRKQSHLDDLLKLKHSNKSLSKLYAEDSNIEIKIIHELPTNNSLVKMMLEMNTISQLNPKANKCVYQVGFARLVFKKSPPDLAEKIVNLILDYYKEN